MKNNIYIIIFNIKVYKYIFYKLKQKVNQYVINFLLEDFQQLLRSSSKYNLKFLYALKKLKTKFVAETFERMKQL